MAIWLLKYDKVSCNARNAWSLTMACQMHEPLTAKLCPKPELTSLDMSYFREWCHFVVDKTWRTIKGWGGGGLDKFFARGSQFAQLHYCSKATATVNISNSCEVNNNSIHIKDSSATEVFSSATFSESAESTGNMLSTKTTGNGRNSSDNNSRLDQMLQAATHWDYTLLLRSGHYYRIKPKAHQNVAPSFSKRWAKSRVQHIEQRSA